MSNQSRARFCLKCDERRISSLVSDHSQLLPGRGHDRRNRPQRSAIMPSPTSRQLARPLPALPRKRGRVGRGLRAVGPILAVIALAPPLAACNHAATSPTAPPTRPVQAQRVAFAPADENREFRGVVRARYETHLG